MLENLFNIAWAVLAVAGIAAALLWRWRSRSWSKTELARELVLFALVAFLLFPIFSMSDDIAYFNYYFARSQAPDNALWMSGARRESPFQGLIILQAFAAILAAVVSAFCLRVARASLVLGQPQKAVSRSAAPSYLRAPPCQVF